MTPSARLQESIAILEALGATAQPLDRLLRDWFRVRRYAGSKDRAAVGEYIFEIMRHRGSLSWRMDSAAPRALVVALLLRGGKSESEIDALFSGGQYAPAPLTAAERAALARPEETPPLAVQGEFPQFLEEELREAFGAHVLNEMQALTERAPVDLRVNRLQAARDTVLGTLRGEGFDAEATAFSPDGIRLPPSQATSRLREHALFKSGAFVFQDEASQIAALLSGTQPGMRVLDIAAGAGGKSLALAAIMDNRGEITAHDIRNEALRELEQRAALAGATMIRTSPLPHMCEGEGNSLFDIVFVDAPCSGSGAWRRQPENKWRLTPERLNALYHTQAGLLQEAAQCVKPGGRLVYATCSILPSENERRVEAFLTSHPQFAAVPAREAWQVLSESPLPVADKYWRGSPYSTGTDGFFCAILTRAA